MNAEVGDREGLRLDKWLWAARIYRSRSLAAAAIQAGRVLVNGARVKPARLVHVGDRLKLNKAGVAWEYEVRELNPRRRSAAEAGKLYQETEVSQAQRLEAFRQARAERLTAPRSEGRPTRRQRRQWTRLNRDQTDK